jgi:hypothetical protein
MKMVAIKSAAVIIGSFLDNRGTGAVDTATKKINFLIHSIMMNKNISCLINFIVLFNHRKKLIKPLIFVLILVVFIKILIYFVRLCNTTQCKNKIKINKQINYSICSSTLYLEWRNVKTVELYEVANKLSGAAQSELNVPSLLMSDFDTLFCSIFCIQHTLENKEEANGSVHLLPMHLEENPVLLLREEECVPINWIRNIYLTRFHITLV